MKRVTCVVQFTGSSRIGIARVEPQHELYDRLRGEAEKKLDFAIGSPLSADLYQFRRKNEKVIGIDDRYLQRVEKIQHLISVEIYCCFLPSESLIGC